MKFRHHAPLTQADVGLKITIDFFGGISILR